MAPHPFVPTQAGTQSVMAGLGPAIRVFLNGRVKQHVEPGTGPGMTICYACEMNLMFMYACSPSMPPSEP
jgi:hypothetical protein